MCWFKINLFCRIRICQDLRIPHGVMMMRMSVKKRLNGKKEKKSASWSNQANHHCHQANPLSICITAPTTPDNGNIYNAMG